MKVALIETHAVPGVWKYDLGLARGLADLGVSVDIITAKSFPDIQDNNSNIRIIRLFPDLRRSRSQFNKGLRYIAATFSTIRLIHSGKYNIVHWQHYNTLPIAETILARALFATRQRLVMTIHDVSPWSVVRGRAAFLLRSTFRSAERIIVHHKANQTDLVKRYELPEKEVRVIPHGSFVGLSGDESGKRESRKLLGLPEEGRFILFFGEIRPEKGLINLVRAMSELRGDVPDSYLVIAGRPRHMDMDECMSEISKLDLADAIIARLHYIDDDLVNAYFSMADVVALPYVDITQSGILFEAMTAGRPVVATDVGGLGPTVREAEVGLVVPPGAPVPLADALKTILNDEQLAAKMSENGRRAALGAFSWSQCADSTLTVYRELVPKEEEKLDTSRLSDG